MAMLSMPEWTCPAWTQNASLVNASSAEFTEVWQSRMRAVSEPSDLSCYGSLIVWNFSGPEDEDIPRTVHRFSNQNPVFVMCEECKFHHHHFSNNKTT